MILQDTRNNFIELINKFIKNIETSSKIEESIYKFSINNNFEDKIINELYIIKSKEIYDNINPSILQNYELLSLISNEKINISNIAQLKPWELFPSLWKNEYNSIKKDTEISLSKKPAKHSTQFKCAKCKKNNCSYVEVQLRSADESASIFVTCLNENCNNTWRIG